MAHRLKASFIHSYADNVASYRLRAQIPARELKVSLNDFNADVLVFCKPVEYEVEIVKKFRNKKIIVDICDDLRDPDSHHSSYRPWYDEMISMADKVTVASEKLVDIFKQREGIDTVFIDNP